MRSSGSTFERTGVVQTVQQLGSWRDLGPVEFVTFE